VISRLAAFAFAITALFKVRDSLFENLARRDGIRRRVPTRSHRNNYLLRQQCLHPRDEAWQLLELGCFVRSASENSIRSHRQTHDRQVARWLASLNSNMIGTIPLCALCRAHLSPHCKIARRTARSSKGYFVGATTAWSVLALGGSPRRSFRHDARIHPWPVRDHRRIDV
jgi:hypothetical protein